MKRERFDYFYLLFGAFCGLLIGTSLDAAWVLLLRRMLFALVILFIAIFWRRFEEKSHAYHIERWDALRARGKWNFVFTHYVVARGIVLIVFLLGPAVSSLHFIPQVIGILSLCGLLVVGTLIYFGVQEWEDCSQEMQVRLLRNTAEFISANLN